MKVIEKQWKYGTYLAYEDVEPELLEFTKGARVLPAPFFYEKRIYFEFVARYEPGEKATFPNGGYEVRNANLGIHSYELDQVVLHPHVIKHKKIIERTQKKVERERKKTDKQREKELKKIEKENKPKGKRGRKPLTEEQKTAQLLDKNNRTKRSGGKRGRPKSSEPKVIKEPKISTGKRGRPPMSEEQKMIREREKTIRTQRSGGKRGRPPKRR